MEKIKNAISGCCGGVGGNEKATPVFDTDRLAAVCKALGHPARLAIVRHLKSVEGCVCGGIVDVLPLAQSTVSQHLKVLRDCGLVQGRIEGPRTCYCLDDDVLQIFKGQIADL
ncbi:ArsR/SmtB family transcription factor [Desulfovibrio ferrophilus]|uniref:Transcriptional regulator, ArsR family n=1 Tax=Desulfovibrio ferrophilus TaxID=241368 RepID=A0A2Z6AZP7_9BACT|nr:metalloregulator ArsR/SmtB family transcription factor [Desulfovibrio ferrophilus]BBD08722.1 transcriptional regulator, ArsR family [Desulfovibrio ferrophilus]